MLYVALRFSFMLQKFRNVGLQGKSTISDIRTIGGICLYWLLSIIGITLVSFEISIEFDNMLTFYISGFAYAEYRLHNGCNIAVTLT